MTQNDIIKRNILQCIKEYEKFYAKEEDNLSAEDKLLIEFMLQKMRMSLFFCEELPEIARMRLRQVRERMKK